MVLTAHQPAYLPWLGLFHKIALADQFVYFDGVQYVPKDFISRNRIKSPQGPVLLTVPVLTKNHYEKSIAEMEINNGLPWARKHWKTLCLNYGKAPYFKTYADFFEDVYNREWTLLGDLNLHMLKWLLNTLGIGVPVERASKLNFKGAKSELVLDMCLSLGARVYIFGELGANYADVEEFRAAGVIPVFQSYHHPFYSQLHGPFQSHMSVVDLLFNEGPRSLEILMSGNVAKPEILGMA